MPSCLTGRRGFKTAHTQEDARILVGAVYNRAHAKGRKDTRIDNGPL